MNIAYENIQNARAVRNVPCGPGGVVHDYAPFYFGRLSPMLFTISRGNVPTYQEGQEPLVYLVSTVEDVVGTGLRYVFTDGHARVAFTEFYDDLASLGEVDWDVVAAQYWGDTDDDNDRKRRKQAEFLVHGGFPWKLVRYIITKSEHRRAEVESLLLGAAHRPHVMVKAGWYY